MLVFTRILALIEILWQFLVGFMYGNYCLGPKQSAKDRGSMLDKLMDQFRESYIRSPRKLCELGFGGFGITASRCRTLGTTLKSK